MLWVVGAAYPVELEAQIRCVTHYEGGAEPGFCYRSVAGGAEPGFCYRSVAIRLEAQKN